MATHTETKQIIQEEGSTKHESTNVAASEEAHTEAESHGGGIHISLKAEEVFRIGDFPITNSLLLAVILLGLFSTVAYKFRRGLAIIPGKLQGLVEFFLENLLELMDSVLEERRKSEKYLPLVATIFLFVLFSNWFGLLPGVGSITSGKVPLFRAPSADLNFTLGLAIVAVVSSNIFGIIAIGFAKHFSKFFTFKDPISFFIGIIEFVSELAKMVSFSFRLFGNIFAGEVLLTIIAFLAPYAVPLPFLFLEVFVGFVQALIFSMLTIVFIAIAIADLGHEESPARAH